MTPPDGPSASGGRAHRLIVDRREGDVVVVEAEDGRMYDLPAWMLPAGLREGDVIRAAAGSGEKGARQLTLAIDDEATEAAREATRSILSRLRGRDPGGDITL